MQESTTQQNQDDQQQQNQDVLSKQEQIEKLLNGEPLDDENQTADDQAAADDDQATDDQATDDQADDDSQGDEIDYSMEIPLNGAGGKVTLGELKDAFQNMAAKTLEIQEIEAKVLGQVEELKGYAELLQVIPPEKMQQITAAREEQIRQEGVLLKTVLPIFATESGAQTATAKLQTLAKDYGLENELGSLVSHKAIKLMYDFAELREKVKAAGQLQKLDKKLPKAVARKVEAQKSAAELAVLKAKQSGARADKDFAIEKLLGG